MRAGLGNLVMDAASASKAALFFAATSFKKLGAKPSHPPELNPAYEDPPAVCVDSDSNLDRAILGPARYDQEMASGKLIMSNAVRARQSTQAAALDLESGNCVRECVNALDRSAEGLPAPAPDCGDMFMAVTCGQQDDACSSNVRLASSMFHSVMVQKGLATADSKIYQNTLPELMCMTPSTRPAEGSHAPDGLASPSGANRAGRQSEPVPSAQSDSIKRLSDGEVDPASTASRDAKQNSTAGSAGTAGSACAGDSRPNSAACAPSAFGGERGEQWVGSGSPDQVVEAGLAVAAENAAAAQAAGNGLLQKLEEGLPGCQGDFPAESVL